MIEYENIISSMKNILVESDSYVEFATKCIIHGFVNYNLKTKNDKTLPLFKRREPYENFIYGMAINFNGDKKLNEKAIIFRYELILLEIENGERSKTELNELNPYIIIYKDVIKQNNI